MGAYDNRDDQIEGQLTIDDLYDDYPERLFAVSKIFARARKEMDVFEQKTFVYALSEMRFTEEAKSNIVYLDKKILANILGIKTDTNHISRDIHTKIQYLAKHSDVHFSKEDIGFYDDGQFIIRVTIRGKGKDIRNKVRIAFNPEYMSLFTGLSENYLTMWSSDIFQMASKRSVNFYEYLRQATDTRSQENSVILGVKALKELFDIPATGEGSYMRKNNHFDRTSFERRVIEPLCDDMKHCKMIQLTVQPNGKYYVKEMRGNRVSGYRFFWTFSAHPAVATAEEVKQIQERVDEDPEVLKVAKDILKGEKKKAKKKTANYEQRDVDYDAMLAKMDFTK